MCSEKRKWIEGNLYSAINHWGLETCISRYLHIVAVVLFGATIRPMPLVGRCWHEKPARMYLDPVRWRPGTTGQKRDYLLWKVNGTQWVKLLRHNRALPTGIWIQIWSEKRRNFCDTGMICLMILLFIIQICLPVRDTPPYVHLSN